MAALYRLLREQITDCFFYILSPQTRLFLLLQLVTCFNRMLHDQMDSSCQQEFIYFVYSVTSEMLIVRPITNILHIQKTMCGATITGVRPQHFFFSFFTILVQNYCETSGS